MSNYPNKIQVLEPDDTDFDPNDISPEDRKELEEIEEMFRLVDMEKNWRESVRKSDAEFVRWFTEENPEFVRKARLRFLRDEIRARTETLGELKKEIDRIYRGNDQEEVAMLLPIVQRNAAEAGKKLRMLIFEKKILLGKSTSTITPELIARAREHPIRDLVETNSRGYALCVNPEHDDHSPSMWTKNNFAHCFSCNWSGDSIDVAMKVYNIKFQEAVKKLAGEI